MTLNSILFKSSESLVCINSELSCKNEVTLLGSGCAIPVSVSVSAVFAVGSVSAVGRGSCDVFPLVPTVTAVKNTGESLKAAGRQTQAYQLRLRSPVSSWREKQRLRERETGCVSNSTVLTCCLHEQLTT